MVYSSLLPCIHLLQVAVKAFRFSFTIKGDVGDKSIKVIICVTTKKYILNCLLDAPSRAWNLEATRA